MKIFDTRNDFIKTLNKDLIICEIGVFKGEFSKFIFDETNPKELHLIDIFEGMMCSGDKDGNNIVWTNLQDEYEKIVNSYSKNKNVTIHKGNSVDILNTFEDDHLDLVYIDGDHTYNGVKNDLESSYKKVKVGGHICGHDYTSHMFEGVVRAVNEFCDEKKLKINYLTKDGCPTFCIIKKIKKND
jgi:hypothetical protein